MDVNNIKNEKIIIMCEGLLWVSNFIDNYLMEINTIKYIYQRAKDNFEISIIDTIWIEGLYNFYVRDRKYAQN
jgi:cobyrinic acid a,c-diamide synthase